MENNENKELCSKCGGKCCKRMPCSMTPADAERILKRPLDKDGIAQLLDAGLFAIDWYENGSKPEYYMRPRRKECNDKFDPMWVGECIFLTPEGCELSFEDRPQGGKDLVPASDGCIGHGKRYYALEWRFYWKDIKELYNEYMYSEAFLRLLRGKR